MRRQMIVSVTVEIPEVDYDIVISASGEYDPGRRATRDEPEEAPLWTPTSWRVSYYADGGLFLEGRDRAELTAAQWAIVNREALEEAERRRRGF